MFLLNRLVDLSIGSGGVTFVCFHVLCEAECVAYLLTMLKEEEVGLRLRKVGHL